MITHHVFAPVTFGGVFAAGDVATPVVVVITIGVPAAGGVFELILGEVVD